MTEFAVDATGRRRFAKSAAAAPGLADLQARVLERVRVAIRNGRFTERGLARAMFITQPHAHNILAGRRGCTAEMADALLEQLGLTVWDVLANQELVAVLALPRWRERWLGGPGDPATLNVAA
jgi:hypothetical protein